jgi:hypothetical protein
MPVTTTRLKPETVIQRAVLDDDDVDVCAGREDWTINEEEKR